jgi:glutaminyl-peptide cyclotransferase
VGRRLTLIAGLAAALAVGAVVAVVALAGDGGDAPPPQPAATIAPDPPAGGFDGARAFAELRRQVALGPRPAGSETLRGLAVRLRRALPHGRFEAVPGHPGLRNIVGRLPGTKPAVAIAAHYDTKRLPGFVGANDGAGGTAAVLELARVLRQADRPRGAPALRFVLFDGEEATDDTRAFERTGIRGSKAYARAHADELRALILLDFVAATDMRMASEASSDPSLWRRLRSAATAAGVERFFPPGTGGAITDDHTPFQRRGVRSIDLIAWPYDCWHQPCDDMTAVSEESLDASGEAVLGLVRRLGGT